MNMVVRTVLSVVVAILFSLDSVSQLFPVDKQKHAAVGFTIASVSVCSKEIKHPIVTALFTSSLAGFSKEYVDSRLGGKFEVKDALTTVTGGLLSGTIAYAIKKRREKKKREYLRNKWQLRQYSRF